MEILWKIVAKIVSIPAVADWIIKKAEKTPYTHLVGEDGTIYMYRNWLFNAYAGEADKEAAFKAGLPEPENWFPISIRVHKIMRRDLDRDKHDHPWNARTMVMKNWYKESRLQVAPPSELWSHGGYYSVQYLRKAGDTASLKFGEYHQITEVHPEGVYTLFITGKYRGTWGFLVNGIKVPYRKYLGLPERGQS